jgi:hypothetical protein
MGQIVAGPFPWASLGPNGKEDIEEKEQSTVDEENAGPLEIMLREI